MTRIYQLIQQLETLTEDANTQQDIAEGYAGVDDTDTVGFSVNSEAAYTAVMKRFGDVIDHDETSGIMYAPADVWPEIEMTAFDADGEGAVKDDGVAEATGDRSFDDMMKTVKKGTLKQATADRRETRKQSQQQARDAFGTMFGGGNPASDLKIKEQGVDENKVSDFVRGQNYKRLARRSGDRATDALDAAIDTGSEEDSDEFAKQQDQYTDRKQRAKSLGASVDESIVVLPPNFPDDMPEEEQRAAWRKWLRNETNKAVAAQTDIQQLAKQLRKQQQEKRNRGESDYMPEAADQNQMDTPEFQQALANLKKKAAQGPSKVAWDPKTSRYRVVPVNDNTMKESVTKEDIITKLKATLGDYLSDVAQAVRKDSDLKDPGSAKPSSVGAVKTIMTDDGHEIRIHGNEDDGFRITIKNKDATAKFASLSEAEMAANLYCAKRRQTPAAQAADYVSEETKDACYHKVKSRYKVWPSAYASGALVQCRKKGAKNWGNKS